MSRMVISLNDIMMFDNSTVFCYFFFFNDTATTEIYTLSLHDALPILLHVHGDRIGAAQLVADVLRRDRRLQLELLEALLRSEEHTSELQSQSNLVCRLLLEKKNNKTGKHGSSCSALFWAYCHHHPPHS